MPLAGITGLTAISAIAGLRVPGPLVDKSLVDYARENTLVPVTVMNDNWVRSPSVEGTKWDQAYPFQFVVVDRSPDGRYIPRREPHWTYTLPIPPEALSISTPFAINTSITMGGSIEEHNGAPIRTINLSGTTGVLFGRDEAPATPSPNGILETVFAGTIAAAGQVSLAAATFAAGTRTYNVNTVKASEFFDNTTQLVKTTGYFQFQLLQSFFEAYVELKKTKEGQNSRLAFCIWKSNEVYLVQPQTFEVRRSAQNPLEYMYSISMKSTKRVRLGTGSPGSLAAYTPVQRSPDKLAKLLQTVENARAVLQATRKTILAVGGDIQRTVFEPMRELSLFAKDALGVPISVADLSDHVVKDLKGSIFQLASTGKSVFGLQGTISTAFRNVSAEAKRSDFQVGILASEIGDDPIGIPSLEDGSSSGRLSHPANSPFSSPSDNYDFFSKIQVGSLNLKPSTTAAIAAERDRVRNLSRLDFETRRDAIAATATSYANAIGQGSSVYNDTYGVTAPASVVKIPSDDDYDTLFALNSLVMEMNRLVVTNANEPSSKVDAIAAVAGLASKSGIAFQIPRSKYPVPFPYGGTLELMALRYLGDPNRWHEIAALNGLQSPYVDETGFELPLLVNGMNRQVFVSTNQNLFVGQPVWVSSMTVGASARRITGIEKNSQNQYVVTLDGDSDLSRYTTTAGAKLVAFLPNTVNSQQTIFIPSDQDAGEDNFKIKSIPGVDRFDQLIGVGGIDLLLTPSNDLVITNDGSARWAVGLTNIIQKVRIALACRQGSLLQHPEFGLPIAVGTSVADLNVHDLVDAAQALFADDPTFSAVRAANVDITGPVARIGVQMEISGSNTVIPISLQVER